MDAQLLHWPLSKAIWMDVGFERLIFVQHMLVPSQAYTLSILNVWHCKYSANLVSDSNWLFNI